MRDVPLKYRLIAGDIAHAVGLAVVTVQSILAG